MAQAEAHAKLDEPPLGSLTSKEQSWLATAVAQLNRIYENRKAGSADDEAYCIFEVGMAYVQFLASREEEKLLCEAVSAKSVPEIATVLTTQADQTLRSLGFKAPEISPNYSQILKIKGVEDLGYAARLAFRVLKEVYRVPDFSSATFTEQIPSNSEQTVIDRRKSNDELNLTLHQPSLYGRTVKPLTVRAIIDHLTKLQRAASALSDAERKFLAAFAAADDHGAFIIEDEFLQAAVNDGKVQREESYSLDDEQREDGGWFGIHRFLGLYVVNSTQYGEGQVLFGPFAKRKEADSVFVTVSVLYTPPT